MAKSEFLAVMAHEIRTPLHQVVGFIDLLGHTLLDKEQTDYIKLLQNSSSAMMTVINDLLDYTKLEAGKMTLESIPFDPRAVVEGALAAITPNAEKKGLRIENNLENMPEDLIGDPNRVRQILLKLLHNAVKFTEHGSVSITVSATKTLDPDDRVLLRFAVQDTGIGISEEGSKRMFSKYQQANPSVAAKYGGTGLGLAICKRLVEAMGGNIGLESEIGKGSTFWFSIAFSLPTLEKVMREVEPSPIEIDPKTHVLLVEDNLINQRMMSSMLKRLGHQVTVAGNGLEALEEIKNNTFGLVLMDVQMPIMDGIEATKQIRSMGFTQCQLPVLALTAGVRTEEHDNIGVNDWLTKPLRPRDLKHAINESLLGRTNIQVGIEP